MRLFIGRKAAVGPALLALAALASCSSPREVQKPAATKVEAKTSNDQKSIALQHFIDGSLYESKNQYAEAIIEYQDALRFDNDPAIYYALAKDYSALNKQALAAEAALQAVKLDSTNITYRETLADIDIKGMQIDDAIAQYRAVLKLDSTRVQSMFNIAQLLAPKYPTQALEMYEKILQRNGPDWEVLFKIAELNSSLHRYDKAAAAFEQMVKIDPSNVSLKQNLGEMYVRSEQYDKALGIFNDLLDSDPGNLEFRGALAEIYIQQNKWEDARAQFDTILQSDSISADTRFRIAMAYLGESQKDSSLVDSVKDQFQKFLTRFPDDWRPMFYLGRLAIVEKNDSLALRYFDKVTKVAGWNAEAWWYLASILFDKKDYAQAVTVLEKAHEIVPNDGGINFLLGYGYTRVDRNEDAIVPLERAIEINPKDINAVATLASTLDALKRYSQSDTTFEAALRLDSLNAMVLNNYAYSLAERGEQLQRAFEMSRLSLSKDSTNAAYLDTFGWIYYRLGNYTEAEHYVKMAIDAGEASAVVYEHLGDIYSRLSQQDKAKEYWTKALERDTKNVGLKEKLARGSL
ncbi:MAG TPA: tetratricopeptide repeat protein [Bacteroidota bacterium]|nr:tetratricopeptide repeat protein [Bacteroidota bacterium]